MSPKGCCILILFLCVVSVVPATATNISFIKAVPYINDYNIEIRNGATGELESVYNTTSHDIALGNSSSYIFVLSYPQDQTISEPDTMLSGILDKIQANKNGMVVGAMVVGILLFAVFMARKNM